MKLSSAGGYNCGLSPGIYVMSQKRCLHSYVNVTVADIRNKYLQSKQESTKISCIYCSGTIYCCLCTDKFYGIVVIEDTRIYDYIFYL